MEPWTPMAGGMGAAAEVGYASNVPSTTAFHRLAKALEDTQRTLRRVVAVADRLVGAIPEPASATKQASAASGGIFGMMDISIVDLLDDGRRAGAALDRIEKALP